MFTHFNQLLKKRQQQNDDSDQYSTVKNAAFSPVDTKAAALQMVRVLNYVDVRNPLPAASMFAGLTEPKPVNNRFHKLSSLPANKPRACCAAGLFNTNWRIHDQPDHHSLRRSLVSRLPPQQTIFNLHFRMTEPPRRVTIPA